MKLFFKDKDSHGICKLLGTIYRYEKKTNNSIRLIPREGRMNILQKLMYLFNHHEKYLHAPPENEEKAIRYPDIGELQEIYEHCRSLIREIFHAKWVNPDTFSGLHVMDLCIKALSKVGDLVLTIDPTDGGHESTAKMLEILGRKHATLPFDRNHHVVDVDKLDSSLFPVLIHLDHSNILFPHDLKKLREIYPKSIIVMDISQIMALVAGGEFPNPLDSDIDLIVGSTHKTLNSAQKALWATNKEEVYRKMEEISKIFISNNHMADISAIAVALEEFKVFGKEYSARLVQNANVLGKELKRRGIPVYECQSPLGDKWLTHTQHIWIDISKTNWNAEEAVKALSEINQYHAKNILLFLTKYSHKSCPP